MSDNKSLWPRESLSSFQDQITASISNKEVSVDSFVVVKLDEEEWLIDIFALKEASVPSKIAKNAGAPNWVLGIANFKGQVWTVIDMRMLLKGRATVNPKWGWVTLLRHVAHDQSGKTDAASSAAVSKDQEQKIGLLWTEIVEIAQKSEYDVHFRLPEQWCKKHYVDKNGKLWKELDVAQLVGPNGVIEAWNSRTNYDQKGDGAVEED